MVKLKVEWSAQARLDLFDILDFYIRRNGSADYSKKLNSLVKKSIETISRNPVIGTQTDYNSVRALITGDYQIIYEVFEQLILIIMIWDCRRDPDDLRIGHRIK